MIYKFHAIEIDFQVQVYILWDKCISISVTAIVNIFGLG